MERFLDALNRFFWSRTFLVFILGCIGFLVFLDFEEDWRGAHAWAATKAKWEAKGVSFDPKAYYPPPVPDDQNLAALAIFQVEPDPKNKTSTQPVALRQATDVVPSDKFPRMGNWQKGEPPDMDLIRHAIAAAYTATFPGMPPPPDTLAQLDALYPFLAGLRSAAATRPLCRLDIDYEKTAGFPATRPLGLLVAQLQVSKILTLHAIVALDEHQPDLALADLKINFELAGAVKNDPSLIGGLVAIGMIAVSNGALYDGLTLHAWNDAQLAELQDQLARFDFLSGYQFTMRAEAITESAPNFDWIKNHRPNAWGLFTGMSTDSSSLRSWWASRLFSLWPNGWLDLSKSRMVDTLLKSSNCVDPGEHRVFAKDADDLDDPVHLYQGNPDAPWNIFYSTAIGPLLSATSHFAAAQVYLDEARLACALERYRLAHNTYPDSLDALAPASIAEVPRDLINGDPLHYQLRPDGSFLLYSVGWNQKDDGGKVVFTTDHPFSPDPLQGDWTWPAPSPAPASNP